MLSTQEIGGGLERILRSGSFRTIKRLRRFLQYVVQETLAGRGDEIKEYTIGVVVYGRGIRFDPRCDGIVRVDAINLRKRLQSYYQNEGVDDTIVISIPKGGYVPAFRGREVLEPIDASPLEEACWRARLPLLQPTPEGIARAHRQFLKIVNEWPSSAMAYTGLAEWRRCRFR